MIGLNDAGSRELDGEGEGDAVGEDAGDADGDGAALRAAASSYATDALMS